MKQGYWNGENIPNQHFWIKFGFEGQQNSRAKFLSLSSTDIVGSGSSTKVAMSHMTEL